MSRLPDLVKDSELHTEFRGSKTIHSYLEIDENGRRSSRQEHWKRVRLLGRGGFGQVQLQRHIKSGAKQDSFRAVKIIRNSDPSGSVDLNRELEAIAKFSNDRYKRWFVKSFGWYEDPTRGAVFIVMEYCRHGDLYHYLKEARLVPASEAQQLAHQILEGLHEMHQNDFAHRDLKPGNILIKSKPPNDWWVVLADFGISKRAEESNGPTTAIKGTRAFMAPELRGCFGPTGRKTVADFKAADMWAFGEIIFQMLTGEPTFDYTADLTRYCDAQRDFPLNRLLTYATVNCCNFVTSIMTASPQRRLTTTQCIQHPWMESKLVEEGLAALNLSQNTLPVSQTPQNEPASARWTATSKLEHILTPHTAQRTPAGRVHSNSSGAEQTPLESTSSNLPHYPNSDEVCQSTRIPYSEKKGDDKESTSPVYDASVCSYGRSKQFYPNTQTYDYAPHIHTVGDTRVFLGQFPDVHNKRYPPPWPIEDGIYPPRSPPPRNVENNRYSPPSPADDETYPSPRPAQPNNPNATRNRLEFTTDGPSVQNQQDQEKLILDHRDNFSYVSPGNEKLYIRYVEFSPDGKMLVSVSTNWPYERHGVQTVFTVLLWDAISGKLVHNLGSHPGRIEDYMHVALSLDGMLLKIVSSSSNRGNGSGTSTGSARLWDVMSGKLLQTLTFKNDRARGLKRAAFSLDGKLLALPSDGRWRSDGDTIELWDFMCGTLVHTFEGHLGQVRDMVFSPDGKLLVSVSRGDIPRLWETASGKLLETFKKHSDGVSNFTVAFSPNGKLLAVWTDPDAEAWDGKAASPVWLFDTASGKLVQTLNIGIQWSTLPSHRIVSS